MITSICKTKQFVEFCQIFIILTVKKNKYINSEYNK